ncbi:MAG TPA: hypothetical protein VIV14_03465 [Gammaproteobacteria bacterium]
MIKRIAPIVENVAESTTACLFMMVQGNVLALTLGHWLIASQTGLIAGALTTAALFFASTDKRWVVAIVLGAVTAVVDFFVHPGMLESALLEALLTGIGAGLLSLAVGYSLQYWRSRRLNAAR